jgi:transposase InsO family protein
VSRVAGDFLVSGGTLLVMEDLHVGEARAVIDADGTMTGRYPETAWAMDFVFDGTAGGRTFRTLNVVDRFTRECLVIEVDRSITNRPRTATSKASMESCGTNA